MLFVWVSSQDKESVLNEAATKFKDLYETKFYPLALELEGQDPYQFLRAFSPGKYYLLVKNKSMWIL